MAFWPLVAFQYCCWNDAEPTDSLSDSLDLGVLYGFVYFNVFPLQICWLDAWLSYVQLRWQAIDNNLKLHRCKTCSIVEASSKHAFAAPGRYARNAGGMYRIRAFRWICQSQSRVRCWMWTVMVLRSKLSHGESCPLIAIRSPTWRKFQDRWFILCQLDLSSLKPLKMQSHVLLMVKYKYQTRHVRENIILNNCPKNSKLYFAWRIWRSHDSAHEWFSRRGRWNRFGTSLK